MTDLNVTNDSRDIPSQSGECENEVQKLQNGDVHPAQIPPLWDGISRESFVTLRSVMAHFLFIFHALSFELRIFFIRSFPLIKF